MLGSRALWIPGIALLAIGAALQAGVTGAVRAIEVSIRLAVIGDPAVSGKPRSYLPDDDPERQLIDADATLPRTRRN